MADAVHDGLLTEKEVDTALGRMLEARFRLGLFDPPAMVPYSKIAANDYDTPDHDKLALQMARESIVLLKNDGLLPLDKAKIKKIGVFGLNANYVGTLIGNYNGDPSHPVTFAQGILDYLGSNNAQVYYAPGCPLAMQVNDTNQAAYDNARAKALDMAQRMDAIVYCGGLSADLEREFYGVKVQGFFWGDRTEIELPEIQTDFLKALRATGKPLVFVNCSGSAMAMPWEEKNLSAIVQAWYPGQEGGRAVAEVLFGEVNPAGRLPVTFYASSADLPSFTDYSMANRTYRYFTGKPLFAFGHGLSYTKFSYGRRPTGQNQRRGERRHPSEIRCDKQRRARRRRSGASLLPPRQVRRAPAFASALRLPTRAHRPKKISARRVRAAVEELSLLGHDAQTIRR